MAGRQAAPENETKEARFIRVGNQRVNKTLAAIAGVGGLANKSSYAWTAAQLDAIFSQIQAETAKAASRFQSGAPASVGFDLGSVKAEDEEKRG